MEAPHTSLTSATTEGELNVLREELNAVTSRFADWKTKAKAGVEKQKIQMLKLADENERLLKRNAELEAGIATLESNVTDIDTSDLDLKLEMERSAIRAEYQKKMDKLRESFNVELDSVEEEKKAAVAAAIANLKQELKDSFGKEHAAGTSAISSHALRTATKLLSNTSEMNQILQQKSTLLTTSLEMWRAAEVRQLQDKLKEANLTFERFKKKVDMTVKLATRDQDDVKGELEDMQNTVREREREVGEAKQAIRQRDIAIEALESRVEELAGMVDQYEDRLQGIDDKERQVDALQVEVQSMEREFTIRNDAMVESHRDEKTSLIERYEEEISSLIKDHEQELSMALSRANTYSSSSTPYQNISSSGGRGAALQQNSGVDEAYLNLMKENEQLKSTVRTTEDTNTSNSIIIRDLKAKLARFEVPASKLKANSGGGGGGSSVAARHMDTDGMDPQIMRRQIYDLEEQLLGLSEQLWHVNQQMLDIKTDSTKKPAAEKKNVANENGESPPQQGAYMKAILLKLLCSQNTEVKSSLMPVLATLFKMNSEELRAVYTSNPSWVK